MGKIYSQIIQNCSGGMTNLLRQNNIRFARKITHFDTQTDPSKLSPYTDFAATTTDIGTIATIKLCRFVAAEKASGGQANIFALGQLAGGVGEFKIYVKDTISAAWAQIAAGNGADLICEKVFVEYKNYLMGWRGTSAPGAGKDLDGTATYFWYITTAGGTLTYYSTAQFDTVTYVAQPIVHSKDDRLYIPFDNYVYYKTSATATHALGITLPTNLIITSICEYGNYLAIACRPKIPMNRNSVVFLWDRDATLTTVTESIDWGPESLDLIDTLDGILIGISSMRNSYSDVIAFKPHLVFKYYGGGIQSAKQIFELPLSLAGNQIIDKQKINNRILFMASGSYGSDAAQTDGIWSLSKTPDGFAVAVEYLYNNATAITSAGAKGFLKFGDYVLAAFTDGGTYKCNLISSGTFATSAPVYETVIFNGGDAAITKKLLSVTILTEPLPAAGSVTVAYKADAETSFTTILTSSTDNAIRKTAINIESTGVNLPQFKEISFQLTSTGNAVITGLKFLYEEILDDVA